MKLVKPVIPEELDADVALAVVIPHIDNISKEIPEYIYEFQGFSERTAMGDDLDITIRNRRNLTSSVKFSLKRDSLYHILPEYLFHSLDHYMGTEGDSEEFDKRYKEQEEQKNKALIYFRPFDRHFQQLRVSYQQHLNENIFSGNQFIADFITDGYDVNLTNPFIKSVYPCLSWLREFRGNDEMISVALGYAFNGKATVNKSNTVFDTPLSENIPSIMGNSTNDLFCGATFRHKACVWEVFYQTKIETEQHLEVIKTQINEFRLFFTLWFLSLDDELVVDFGDKLAVPELTAHRGVNGIFLNYNTQLI